MWFVLDTYATKVPSECSVWKGIPIEFRDHPDVLEKLATGNYRIKYRGPRYDWMNAYCLKENARTFAIYRK